MKFIEEAILTKNLEIASALIVKRTFLLRALHWYKIV